MQQREESEWNDEEKKIVAEYHKKCADLEEEREKYHKVCERCGCVNKIWYTYLSVVTILISLISLQQLEQELRKLQQAITEGTHAFDEVLQQLFYRKVKTEMVIYQVKNFVSMITNRSG